MQLLAQGPFMANTPPCPFLPSQTIRKAPRGRRGGNNAENVAPSSKKARKETLTVERHLMDHAETLIRDLDAYTDSLCKSLRAEAKRSKADIVALYEKKNGAIPKVECEIVLTVESGPHEGEVFRLQPFAGICPIGRSTGKRYRERGVSLPNDPETSTSHAKVRVMQGKIMYTDVGSTNGTFINGESVEQNESYELSNGMELGIGACRIRVALVPPTAA